MSEREEEERIETIGGWFRVKMRGTTMVAVELTCPQCHQPYWQLLQRVLGHSCQPERLGGASVINKYG